MTPEQLEKLALARVKAGEARAAMKEDADGAKMAILQKKMDAIQGKKKPKAQPEPEPMEEPNTRPQDIVSAEMSQAAYIDHIKNPDIMEDFVNRVSSLKEQGWKLHSDSKTHNEYTKTFVHAETGKVAVAYRGTQTWIGQDGRANISNL